MNNDLHQETLHQRGIAAAAHKAGWRPKSHSKNPGWEYDVFDRDGRVVARRWKAAPDADGPKYIWPTGKPTGADYYVPDWDALHAAVTEAGGVLHIVNGEPAVLTMHAAGIYNVLCWFGENSVPPTLVRDLHALNVMRVLFIADNDEAGHNAAVKVRDALAGTGIDYEAFDLAGRVDTAGDVNDLWIVHDFDRTAFIETLETLPPLNLPAPEPKEDQSASRYQDYEDEDFPSEYVRDVIDALMNPPKAKLRGTEISCCSPMRDDDENPSFSFSTEKLCGFDHREGEGYGIVEIGRELDIDITDYRRRERPMPTRRHAPDIPPPPESSRSWPPAPVDLPGLTADITLNQQYVSDTDIDSLLDRGQGFIVRSSLGSGETELEAQIANALEKRLEREPRVLNLTPRRSMVGVLADRFDATPYNELPRDALASANRLVIPYDYLLDIPEDMAYDLIVIEDIEHFLRHLPNNITDKNARTAAYTRLVALMGNAGYVIGLDAHATDAVRDWMQEVVAGDVVAVVNTCVNNQGHIHLCLHKNEDVIAKSLTAVQANPDGTYVLATGNKKLTQVYAQLAADKFGEEAVMLVNADNSENPDVQHFLRNINQELPRYRIIIVSPSVEFGLAVTAPVAGVFGIFHTHPLLPTGMLQMLSCFRNAAEYHVFVTPATTDKLETDWEVLYNQEILRADGSARRVTDQPLRLTPAQHSFTKLQARLKACDNLQRSDILAAFYTLVRAQGFILRFAKTDEDHQALRDELKAVRKTLEEERKALTCRVRVLPYEEYSRRREDPKATLTPEHHAGYERWKIEETVGLTINEQIYDYFQHPADRAALRLFTDLETSTGKLLARDRKELKNDVLLPNRGHYTRRIEIINGLLCRLFPHGLDSNEELTIGDINRRIQSVQDLLPDFHLYFRSRSDRSQKPIAVLRQILRRLGLKLTGRRVQRNKVRFWLYRIDSEHLNQWRMFAAARREHRQQKKAERADRATFRDNSGSVSFRKVARRWENRPGAAFPPSRSSPGGAFRPPAV